VSCYGKVQNLIFIKVTEVRDEEKMKVICIEALTRYPEVVEKPKAICNRVGLVLLYPAQTFAFSIFTGAMACS
jgi:hypothetical protein